LVLGVLIAMAVHKRIMYLRKHVLFIDFHLPIKSKEHAMNVLPKSGRACATNVAVGKL